MVQRPDREILKTPAGLALCTSTTQQQATYLCLSYSSCTRGRVRSYKRNISHRKVKCAFFGKSSSAFATASSLPGVNKCIQVRRAHSYGAYKLLLTADLNFTTKQAVPVGSAGMAVPVGSAAMAVLHAQQQERKAVKNGTYLATGRHRKQPTSLSVQRAAA